MNMYQFFLWVSAILFLKIFLYVKILFIKKDNMKVYYNPKKFNELDISEKSILDDIIYINSGSFSDTYRFKDKYTIKKLKESECHFLDNLIEIGIYNSFNCQNILKLECVFIHEKKLNLVTPYSDCSLKDFVFTNIHDKIDVINQLCEGLDFLHKKYILHLDIKPSNILLNTSNKIKVYISDFSLSCRAPTLKITCNHDKISPFYRPYENLKGSREYSDKSDIWSLGIIIYEILQDKKIEDEILTVNINGLYSSEYSMLLYLERLLAWKKWPRTFDDMHLKMDFSSFCSIDINKRILCGKNSHPEILEYNYENNPYKMYEFFTEKLYKKIIKVLESETTSLESIFQNKKNLHSLCFIIIQTTYNPNINLINYTNFIAIHKVLELLYLIDFKIFD